MTSAGEDEQPGVGPAPEPWPDDPRLDPELLAAGDRRNVADRYRYWRVDAIVADLDERRHPFHVAVENWQHDLNIGAVVRNANAFLAAEVHIVGARRWNRRGAMVTDRYLHIRHHPTLEEFAAWARSERLPVLGVDNLPGSVGDRRLRAAASLRAAVRPGGTGVVGGGAGAVGDRARDPAVRVDAVDQRGRGERGRDARVGAAMGSAGSGRLTRLGRKGGSDPNVDRRSLVGAGFDVVVAVRPQRRIGPGRRSRVRRFGRSPTPYPAQFRP